MIHTPFGFRIKTISEGTGYDWIFLPGGPGLGSEYLEDFCRKLRVPGSIFLADFPMDGTNYYGKLNFHLWREGLLDLLQSFKNPILVTHSFAGMFVLNMPDIEKYLAGLVVMNTTTANTFFQRVHDMHVKYHLPDLAPAASAYHMNPSDETYKAFWDDYKYYCFTPEELAEGEKMIPLFAFNSAAYHYAVTCFYPEYECRLQLSHIPAMTITSENDFICPPAIFIQDKRFQSKNMINKIIPNAGHCPWVNYFDSVQDCFSEYAANLSSKSST